MLLTDLTRARQLLADGMPRAAVARAIGVSGSALRHCLELAADFERASGAVKPRPAKIAKPKSSPAPKPKRPPSQLIDLAGQKFGRLTVIERVPSIAAREPGSSGHHSLWRCRCECGGEKITRSSTLRRGHATSCGCKQSEVARAHLSAARAARWPNGRGFAANEALAVDEFIASGKVARIENGKWPDLGRPEVVKFKSPHLRAMLKARAK
jgi:hypothetical protein